MAVNKHTVPGNKHSVQNIMNWSFDPDFNVIGMELLAYDSVNDVMRRVTTDSMGHFGTNDVDKNSSTVFYEGLEDLDGNWQVVKTTMSPTVTSNRFATLKNNPTVTTYTDAWTGRAGLTYELYSLAF